uniref:Polyprenyl synthetase n=2 Tax=Lutzomyia longipalpis TaxID=7200 RepID=A0A1B0CWK8_LUTLO
MPGGNRYCGVMTAETHKILTPDHQQTRENLKLASYLGWCFEIILDSFNALDDILDRSEMRNGVPCWYLQNNLGNLAIVDGLLLQCGTYHILRKYFGHLDCYLQVIEVINEAIYRTHVGLRTDIKASEDTKFISTKIYQDIAINTTFYAASLLPVSLGLLLSGHKDLQALKKAEPILAEQGLYYVIENDYFDCYGDPKVIKKLANDIQEGKCCWPAVVCMELASPEQKAIMKENYGKADPKCVARIKQLYTDLNLPQIFEDYTVDLINRLERDIENTLDGDIKKVTLMLTEAISYSRHRGRPIY